MSRCKLSNQIFELGLDAQELSIYAYLCSLPSDIPTLDGTVVKVKQSTIASKCGIRAVQTVSRVIQRLNDKGLVEPLTRSVKANRHKGTYSYNVKKLSTEDSFFIVDRYIFGRLIPRQMMIYLFICKSFSFQFGDCWNSFNDISAQTGMKRETVIRTINELAEMKLIVRNRRKSKNNRRVYVDNHYQIISYVPGRIRKKGKVRLHLQYNRTKDLDKSSTNQYYDNTFLSKCQDFSEKFFLCRGSP